MLDARDNVILTSFIKRWLFPPSHEQPIEFYSGRMLAYNLCVSFNLDAERLYEIEPATYRDKFRCPAVIVRFLEGDDIDG